MFNDKSGKDNIIPRGKYAGDSRRNRASSISRQQAQSVLNSKSEEKSEGVKEVLKLHNLINKLASKLSLLNNEYKKLNQDKQNLTKENNELKIEIERLKKGLTKTEMGDQKLEKEEAIRLKVESTEEPIVEEAEFTEEDAETLKSLTSLPEEFYLILHKNPQPEDVISDKSDNKHSKTYLFK